MDLQELKMPKATGIKFVLAAKEIVKETVKVQEEKEFSMTFRHRGFYGKVEFSDMLPLVSVHTSKKLKEKITEEDKILVKKVNTIAPTYKNVNPALLELNISKNTCVSGTVVFLEGGFNEEIFLKAVNQCCDKLQAFLDEKAI